MVHRGFTCGEQRRFSGTASAGEKWTTDALNFGKHESGKKT